jgi:cytokinin riboside 5'-monophosphate phosphoribohydrolase
MSKPTVCIYCGSSLGGDPVYSEAAKALSTRLANEGFNLIYGGASIGIMGVVANTFLECGAKVTGVIPESLASREIAHIGLSELIITMGMHERKALMADRADAFIALPGGYGTFEELLEVITWRQIRIMDKPVVVYNVDGYFNSLLAMLDEAETKGFVRAHPNPYFRVACNLDELLKYLESVVIAS